MELLERHFDTALAAPNGIKKLREMILTLAMQGKLVAQDPNDPPADGLLKEIEAEKRRLVNEGIIKDTLPIKFVSQSHAPYTLPKGWRWVRLGSIAVIERGGSPRPINSFLTDAPDGLNWIKIGDTEKGGKFITSTREKIRPEGLSKTRMVYPGDFLLTNSMSFGRPYITRIEGCIHDGWLRISPPSSLNKDYLYHLLSSSFVKTLFDFAAAGAVVQNLNAEKVREISIPLPPSPEQIRIVAKIDELMARCEELEKLRAKRDAQRLAVHAATIRKLLNLADADGHIQGREFLSHHFGELYTVNENVAELRKAILQLAVMGKLVPQDPSDPPASGLLKQIQAERNRRVKDGKIKEKRQQPGVPSKNSPYTVPQGWEWVRVSDIVEVGTGSTPPTANREYYQGTIPWYTSSATNRAITDEPDKFISEKAIRDTNCKVFPAGSLIVALYGQGKTRGQVSELGRAGATNQAIAALVFNDASIRAKSYLKYFFVKIYEEIRSISEGAAQPNLNVGKVKDTLVPLPPLKEQERITAKIDQLMSSCDALDRQIDATAQSQASLLNAIMAQVGEQRCA